MYDDISCHSQQLARTGVLWPRDPRPAPGGDLVALEICMPPFEPPGMMPPNDGSGYGSVDGVASPRTSNSLGLKSSPNPFNCSTRISFEAPRSERVDLSVYDVRGRLVRVLVKGRREGARDVEWDGRDAGGRFLPSGVYLVRLEVGERTATKKVVLLR